MFTEFKSLNHRLINDKDKTQDVVFSRFIVKEIHKNSETEAQRNYAHALSLSCHLTKPACNSSGLL